MFHSNWIYRFIGLLLLGIAAIAILPAITAQETPVPTIEFTGTIESINGTTLVISGLTVDSNTLAITNLQVGTMVTVTGVFDGTRIVANTIIIAAQAAPTPEVTPEGTLPVNLDTDPIIVIEGPVTMINLEANFITIFDFDININGNDPIFTLVDIGDELRVVGVMGADGGLTAVTVGNITTTTVVNTASVGLEGPVEAINGNIVTVNGVQVQLDPNDPILSTLVLGDFLSVQGNFVNNGTIIVLVVVNIVIVDITIDVDYCWYHEGMGMGMGHWHCDGMGMGGMGGMGMGN